MQTKDFYKQNSERAGNKSGGRGKKTVDWKKTHRALWDFFIALLRAFFKKRI